MSNMSNLEIEIEEMLEQGRDPLSIARILEIPVTWVYEVNEIHNAEESYDPFETVNS